MTTWLILAGIVWAGPKLTPQQAADVLRTSPATSNRTDVVAPPPHDGPRVVVIGSTPGALTWLPAAVLSEKRRLDGTLISQPPDAIVAPIWPVFWPMTGYGHPRGNGRK